MPSAPTRDCPKCEGYGQLSVPAMEKNLDGGMDVVLNSETCPECNGVGVVGGMVQ